MHELTRVIYKFIPMFGKLKDLASYQTKSRDKLVNQSCQLMYSLACFLTFYVCDSLFPASFSTF